MNRQLVQTLTDAATVDAAHISGAVGLEGCYGVYDSVTEYLDEFVDGFYKPRKNSLLHMYIQGELVNGLIYEAVIENAPEEYVLKEHTEELFQLFGYSFSDVGKLPPGFPDYEEENFYAWESFAEEVNNFYCDNINDKWVDHVFYILFSNKDFLFRFNTEIARIVQELKKTDYPDILKKDGVIRRNKFPVWVQKAIKMRDRNRCQLCGKDLSGTFNLSNENFDHIIPLEDGGTNDPCNIQLTCEHCNKSKGARSRNYKNIMIPFW